MRLASAALVADPPANRVEILVVRAEAQVLDSFPLAVRVHGSPAMRIAHGAKIESIAFALHIEPECRVEAGGLCKVRDREHEPVE